MFCIAQVDRKIVQLILDSGSSSSVITKTFLDKLGKKINWESKVNIVGIHEEKRWVLEDVFNLSITIKKQELLVNVVVSEASGYDLLVGNNWLSKYSAVIDYEKGLLTFKSNSQEFEVLASY